ncbi:isocitrate lyase/phosphoenolpyruvate mutase family protein [Sphingosinicella sp. CPCC 101087]|uniref:isocitrate lyase/PEP mutase family protein n=1 Tax=Sphingosinicella sp. CPCC 101087 TaxID=2497754 RepID=UPI0013ECF337|nr:isocitrate lyase/phosphoenolpyruvate mutase family protein [Sphingosinicella sp. CPCC 101087]
MSNTELLARIDAFRELSLNGRQLLPNAWDGASARLFEHEGFPAIGTTSGGIANARGAPDCEILGRDAMLREAAVIITSVDIPVTVDIEAGYGDAPDAVAETVELALNLGAVGVNIEDRNHRSSCDPLYAVKDQAARLAAARSTGDLLGLSPVINARTDTFLIGAGADLQERVAMTIERGRAYLEAGADLVFVPGLVDLTVMRQIADAFDGRLSVMALPGAPRAEAMFEAGARRVSLGAAAMLACLGTLRNIAREARQTGTWNAIERSFFSFDEADALFTQR